MKSNIREFTQKLFLLMDTKDGSHLQELVDELIMDLQLRTLLKLHHFYSILLRGGCLPEWDEL